MARRKSSIGSLNNTCAHSFMIILINGSSFFPWQNGPMTHPCILAQDFLPSKSFMHSTLQHRLLKSQNAMKTQADAHHWDVQLDVGDWVYVKLRPYHQTSLQPSYSKLSKRYNGPYLVEACVVPVAYQLHLRPGSKIHPIFHVSLLKPHQGPITSDTSPLPPLSTNNHPIVRPLQFLDWKIDTASTPPTQQVLVQWDDLTPEDTS